MAERYWLETLGCPKNQVDSDKLAGTLVADGMQAAERPEDADLVVVNTCAFIEAAREESIDTILALSGARRPGARLVVTGCLAERYGAELAEAMPEVDLVAGFGVLRLARGQARPPSRPFDLLNLPRPKATAPWAYVKVAEGLRPHLRLLRHPVVPGAAAVAAPRSRSWPRSTRLEAVEIVLVAQDLGVLRAGHRAQGGHHRPGRGGGGPGRAHPPALPLPLRPRRPPGRRHLRHRRAVLRPFAPARCPSPCSGACADGATAPASWPASRPSAGSIPTAAFRSSFIVGYPGETEDDHDALLRFVEEAGLDWAGFFAYSREDGTHAAGLDGAVAPALMAERLAELGELQDRITAERRSDLIGEIVEVLVDEPGVGRSHREAPEIDGIIAVPADLAVGSFAKVTVTGAAGPDLEAA